MPPMSSDETKAPETQSSRLLQRYKSLESEASSFLGKKHSGYQSRARAFTPSLKEIKGTSFADYIRFTVLQCGTPKEDEIEGDEEPSDIEEKKKGRPQRMHTRNYCPPGEVRSYTKPKHRDYTSFQMPMCWMDGMAKVTLPEGWWDQEGIGNDTTARGPGWQSGTDLGDMMVENPIKQCVSGIGGVYEYTLLDMPSVKLHEFRQKADEYRKRQVKVAVENDMEDETCDGLARKFWRRLGPTMEPPMYGADMDGSLFDGDEACGWNVEQLDSCLQLLSGSLPGVTSPYLYVGMWASVFCQHTEDMNLLSINYLHAGAPKYWYAISPEDSKRFESLAESHFGHAARNCSEFLRHKRNLLSPAILKKAGISFTTQIQRPGDAIITFPGSYHFGFNTGFNVAESTNFAVPEWINSGLEAGICMCHPHSVRIDMTEFQSLLQRYEDATRRARRVGYRQLTYQEWIQRESDSDEEEEEEENPRKRKDGFLVEVIQMRQDGTSMIGKRSKTTASEEDWRLARKLFRASVVPNTKVLCFMVSKEETDPEISPNSQCFAGVITEVVDKHVRIHFAGMKRQDDVWMPMGSPKLFLDGGKALPKHNKRNKTVS